MNKKSLINSDLVIIGAGPIGLTLSIFLKRLGYQPIIYEKRTKSEVLNNLYHRSVNITLSHRGLVTLKSIGCDVQVINKGHKIIGRNYILSKNLNHFTPYTRIKDKYLVSIKRQHLLQALLQKASEMGVLFKFGYELKQVNFESNTLSFKNRKIELNKHFQFLYGCDGINSVVSPQLLEGNVTMTSHSYGYKKIDITKNEAEEMNFCANCLNILSQEDFMFLSLPNKDGSHSGLIHADKKWLKLERNLSEINELFEDSILGIISDIDLQFRKNKIGQFESVNCKVWHNSNTLILGDAAHGMVPFYGQGTNTGFENVSIYADLLKSNNYDFAKTAKNFHKKRKLDVQTISRMSEGNIQKLFLTKEDIAEYVVRNNLESKIEYEFENYFSEYYNVAFTNKSFSYINEISKIQNRILKKEVWNIRNYGKSIIDSNYRSRIYNKIEKEISKKEIEKL